MLVDIGVNLTSGRFHKDLDEVVQRAVNNGVSRMVVTGTNEKESQEALELAKQYPQHLTCTAGVHPHHADDFNENTILLLRQLLAEPEVKAAGECGLDYNRNFSTPENQRNCFEQQLQLAAELGMPVFLHQRDAHDDFVSILSNYINEIPAAVAHCFTGSQKEMETYIGMGLSIGITGWVCDERRGAELKSFVHKIPLDRLMIETDAPYLLPRDIKPRPKSNRNESAYLPHICQTLAECYQLPYENMAAQTTQNALKFFNLV